MSKSVTATTLTILCMFVVSGCSRDELQDIPNDQSDHYPPQEVYYQGSDASWDYWILDRRLCLCRSMSETRRVKTKIALREMPRNEFTDDQSKWLQYFPGTNEFGSRTYALTKPGRAKAEDAPLFLEYLQIIP